MNEPNNFEMTSTQREILDVVGDLIRTHGESYINLFFVDLYSDHEAALENDPNLMDQYIEFNNLMNKFHESESKTQNFSTLVD